MEECDRNNSRDPPSSGELEMLELMFYVKTCMNWLLSYAEQLVIVWLHCPGTICFPCFNLLPDVLCFLAPAPTHQQHSTARPSVTTCELVESHKITRHVPVHPDTPVQSSHYGNGELAGAEHPPLHALVVCDEKMRSVLKQEVMWLMEDWWKTTMCTDVGPHFKDIIPRRSRGHRQRQTALIGWKKWPIFQGLLLLLLFYSQASCASGSLTSTPVGPMDSRTPPSVCRVLGICRGTIKVRDSTASGYTLHCIVAAGALWSIQNDGTWNLRVSVCSSTRHGVSGVWRQRPVGDNEEHQRVWL